MIGQGAFGPVYKAQMTTGETVAVKVLSTDSKQGEREFQTEVILSNLFMSVYIDKVRICIKSTVPSWALYLY